MLPGLESALTLLLLEYRKMQPAQRLGLRSLLTQLLERENQRPAPLASAAQTPRPTLPASAAAVPSLAASNLPQQQAFSRELSYPRPAPVPEARRFASEIKALEKLGKLDPSNPVFKAALARLQATMPIKFDGPKQNG